MFLSSTSRLLSCLLLLLWQSPQCQAFIRCRYGPTCQVIGYSVTGISPDALCKPRWHPYHGCGVRLSGVVDRKTGYRIESDVYRRFAVSRYIYEADDQANTEDARMVITYRKGFNWYYSEESYFFRSCTARVGGERCRSCAPNAAPDCTNLDNKFMRMPSITMGVFEAFLDDTFHKNMDPALLDSVRTDTIGNSAFDPNDGKQRLFNNTRTEGSVDDHDGSLRRRRLE